MVETQTTPNFILHLNQVHGWTSNMLHLGESFFASIHTTLLHSYRRLIEGRNVLRKLGQVETYNERPLKLCQVSNCGKLTPDEQQSLI